LVVIGVVVGGVVYGLVFIDIVVFGFDGCVFVIGLDVVWLVMGENVDVLCFGGFELYGWCLGVVYVVIEIIEDVFWCA